MLDFIAWYVLVTALGWIVFPLLFHTLSDIPGRGIHLLENFRFIILGVFILDPGTSGIYSE